ncbi:hypothetical protein GC175_12995 [bacterium]|nr:hypothetical protein [bacterium]
MTEMLGMEREKDQQRRLQKLAHQRLHVPGRQNRRQGQHLVHAVGSMMVRLGMILQAYSAIDAPNKAVQISDCN